MITVVESRFFTDLIYANERSAFVAMSAVKITVFFDDCWILDNMVSKLVKNASFCSLACCHSLSKDLKVESRRDKETETFARSDSASIKAILDLKPAKHFSRTNLAFAPTMAFLRYNIVSPSRDSLKRVKGIRVPQVFKALIECNKRHSSQPVGLALRKRSAATVNLETQGRTVQKDKRSISLDRCRVAVQIDKEDRELRSFGSSGSCFISEF